MALTLANAHRAIEAAIAKAEEFNIKISVAVCDDKGRLAAFARMDGAIWASIYGCQGKAFASSAFARPSGELMERADSPILRGINAADGNHMIMSLGAVPIIVGGELVGACGVGGGTGEQDEDCARAGASAIS